MAEDQPEIDTTQADIEAVEEAAAELPEVETAPVADSFESRLQQAESRAAEYLDGLQRERATFQNYKRRVEREKAEQAQVIAGSVLFKLLPVLDDFNRAMSAVPAENKTQWFEGIALIQRKFEKFLEDQGVSEINALGQAFDPNFHEAISVDTDSEAASGTITQVLQRGYLQGERVLRPAMVRVAE
ncbi:MAG: nucleotide exchange factor GrpE [Chloroflexi bacterium]|nr:nucleotide exchange factor GrpE [Chloroflexota bacterium]